jgi:hypothetical protein
MGNRCSPVEEEDDDEDEDESWHGRAGRAVVVVGAVDV